MTKLSVIWKTLTLTKNPFIVLSMKRDKSRKAITFRNGLTYNLNWPQFRTFRDTYSLFANCSVTQIDEDIFKIKDQRSEVVCNSQLMPVICNLMEDFSINQIGKDTFHIKKENFQVVGSKEMLICVQELKTGEYECDYQNRVVLDVGGFEGESAVYFWSKKAKKIIIYEPVAEHVRFIEKNIELNKINAEVHSIGIGNQNGTHLIQYNVTDPGFGFHSKGIRSMEIKIRNVSEVIQESGAEIAKFDCEGAEESLVDVPEDILRKIEYYIIETHSLKIKSAILEKFQKAGFKLKKEADKTQYFSVLTFIINEK
jgi:FkbM family methyltransferase